MTYKQMLNLTILCFAANFYCSSGQATESATAESLTRPAIGMSITPTAHRAPIQVLTFQQWREQQVNAGQNLLIRLSNQLTRLKSTTGPLDKIRAIESEQRVAARNLELLRELTIEDYLFFYLAGQAEDPRVIRHLAYKMSKKEVEVLLRSVLFRIRETQLDSTATRPHKSQIFEI